MKTEEFNEILSSIPDKDLTEKIHKELSAMCKTRKVFTMTIPPDPERDFDILLGELIRRFDKLSLPVEAQVSQENGEHPLHTFRAKDGRFKYTSLASRKIHNDIVFNIANKLEQFVSEQIRTETQ